MTPVERELFQRHLDLLYVAEQSLMAVGRSRVGLASNNMNPKLRDMMKEWNVGTKDWVGVLQSERKNLQQALGTAR